MSQDIARNVALVTYGNVFLQKQTEFDIDTLVTHNCYRLDFIEPPVERIAGSTKILAKDAPLWFKYLKDQGAKKLKIHYQTLFQSELPDHISTAFVGGGSHWFVEVQFEKDSDLYLSDWVPPEDSEVDMMKTHYIRIEKNTRHLDGPSPSVAESREQLQTVLQQLSKLAGKFEFSKHWVSNFEIPLTTLREFEPKVVDEFLPAGIYSKEAHQLIVAAFGSWVFGGMGSWNDLVFSGDSQDLYTSLSDNLYSTICKAIVSAVNSYP
ncbi:hypothetical protein E4H12_14115 [Candidatus Thorarchaeota archaeon]|nr:MAG: hypothetical protein E4H12_14115 [Candidatus Thorarchaeota archaeon]